MEAIAITAKRRIDYPPRAAWNLDRLAADHHAAERMGSSRLRPEAGAGQPGHGASVNLMNVRLVVQRSQQTLDAARRRQIAGTTFGEQDARRYEEMLMLVQYYRFREDFNRLLQEKPEPGQGLGRETRMQRSWPRRCGSGSTSTWKPTTIGRGMCESWSNAYGTS